MEPIGERTIEALRADFPIFTRRPGLAYLDSAATTHMPRPVLEAVMDFETGMRANVHRGVYAEAEMATEAYEGARERIAGYVSAKPHEIIFTGGVTAGMNMLAAMVAPRLAPGDAIVASAMEHHSARLPWEGVARDRGVMLTTVPHAADYRFDCEAFSLMLRHERVRVVVVTAASNVLGTVNPIKRIVDMAHEHGALVVVDAAQYAPHLALNVRAWGADAVLFSGHKLYGPMGVGVLYLAEAFGAQLDPSWLGGGMVKEVLPGRITYEDAPWKFEAGTPNVGGVIGLGAALDYVCAVGFDRIAQRETELTRELIVGLLSFGDVRIVGPDTMEDRIGVVSFTFPDIHPHDLATLLGRRNVAVRAGHHCAMPLVHPVDPRGVCRASIGLFTTRDDIAQLVDGIYHARGILRYD